jgi:hypothetical protein
VGKLDDLFSLTEQLPISITSRHDEILKVDVSLRHGASVMHGIALWSIKRVELRVAHVAASCEKRHLLAVHGQT